MAELEVQKETNDDPGSAGSGNDSDPHPGPPEPRYHNAEDNEEEPYGYKDPEDVSSAYKARDCVIEMYNRGKASKVCRLILVCGLKIIVLVVTAAILVPYIVPRMKEAQESTVQDDMVTTEKLKELSTPWSMAYFEFMENSSEVGYLTSPVSPSGWETAETVPLPVTSLPITVGQCHRGWSEYNNHCYKIMKDKVKWSEANARCKQLGANLTSILNDDETDFIRSLDSDAPHVWIGLHKDGGRWKWSDGSRVTYTKWSPGEPNNSILFRVKGGEKCAFVYYKTRRAKLIGQMIKKAHWNDSNCRKKRRFLCKIPKQQQLISI